MTSATAPGRCTLVGEHVDYAGGLVLAMAIDLELTVHARIAADGVWSVGDARRTDPDLQRWRRGDVADRPLAVIVGLRELGVVTAPLRLEIAASLPAGAGLSSSAALSLATAVAVLRLAHARLTERHLAALAHHAEHDLMAIPCGTLDQVTVTSARATSALLLDCAAGTHAQVAWGLADDLVVVACDTGEPHRVADGAYAERRHQVDSALAAVGARDCQSVDAGAATTLADPVLRRRLAHVVGESARATAAAAALAAGDGARLGALMSASHASLRDNLEVSSDGLDRAVAAALGHPACLGARMVGAGFGGSAIALVPRPAARAVRAAMASAVSVALDRTWEFEPSAGVAERAPDVVEVAGG